ncbi:MAG: nitroreductase family protein [Acidobacteriia bacterium]|nr:nitroreductase family protein [Terriglobia bacterium]
MQFFDVIQQRRSIRSFLQRPVAEEKLRCILEAANTAPSAGNFQSYEIYVVSGKRARLDLARAAHEQLFIAGAPLTLVFCTHSARSAEHYGKRGEKLYSVQDAAIACAFAMLAATVLGLGSVWVGSFESDQVREVIGSPPGIVPVAMLPIGHSAERPDPQERRGVKDLVHWVQ